MITWSRKLAWSGAAVAIALCGAAVTAQERNGQADLGSLAALTAEVRQLRLAVEESTRSQTQTQALGVYLSAEQSRLVQVAARLDAARKELDTVTLRSKQLATEISRIGETLLRETNPEIRKQLEAVSRDLKQELENIGPQEQLARSREADLSQMMQSENTRWNELISALEQMIKK